MQLSVWWLYCVWCSLIFKIGCKILFTNKWSHLLYCFHLCVRLRSILCWANSCRISCVFIFKTMQFCASSFKWFWNWTHCTGYAWSKIVYPTMCLMIVSNFSLCICYSNTEYSQLCHNTPQEIMLAAILMSAIVWIMQVMGCFTLCCDIFKLSSCSFNKKQYGIIYMNDTLGCCE